MFRFLLENDLVSPTQSGFKPGDSYSNQLLSITHKGFQSLDEGFEVRSVFLNFSKAFDKVWHKGLIFKLSQNGIPGNLPDILSDFLSDENKVFFLMVKNVHGKMSTEAFLKVPFWDHCRS